MKAITLWQPWATAMAFGLKRIETRSWGTRYRGELAVHSSKREPYAATIAPVGERAIKTIPAPWPRGSVVAVCELVECVPIEQAYKGLSDLEYCLGDYSGGRYAWITRSLRKLKEPVPCRGRQGIWNVSPELEKLIREQL